MNIKEILDIQFFTQQIEEAKNFIKDYYEIPPTNSERYINKQILEKHYNNLLEFKKNGKYVSIYKKKATLTEMELDKKQSNKYVDCLLNEFKEILFRNKKQ